MSIVETYLFLLADSFITGLVLPARYDLVFSTMKIFGGYNMYLASFIATTGISLAALANWLLGCILNSLKKDNLIEAKAGPAAQTQKVMNLLQKHGYWLGLLSFIPIFGPILTVFAGIAKTNWAKLVIITFIVNLLWHLSGVV